MKKSKLNIALFLGLTLMISSQKISALELNPQASRYSCLSDEQADKIANCFSERDICETSLKSIARSDHDYLTAIELSILGGLVAGAIAGMEFHK